jgi:hypothetical protein
LKLSVAYKNKGGKIIKINSRNIMKITLDIIALDSSLEISVVITIVAISAQVKDDTTIVNLLKPYIAYENEGGKMDNIGIVNVAETYFVNCLFFVHV